MATSRPPKVNVVDPWQRYEQLEELGRGSFGVIYRVRDRKSQETLACKLIKRGKNVDENVRREIINHRNLKPHPNVIGFREVFLTQEYLGIVMEFASGGELFKRVQQVGRFPESLARYYFQQLICGLDHLHKEGVCHRDLKLENTLLDGNRNAPLIKICDFGYSKRQNHDSAPHSTVGTSSYVAPEVLCRGKYDGQIADVWSAGVVLYIMLVGRYPFDDPQRPYDMQSTISRILRGQYAIPSNLGLSREVVDLLKRLFQVNPANRIPLSVIKRHKWYQTLLPDEIRYSYQFKCKIKPFPHSQQAQQEIDAALGLASRAGPPGVAVSDNQAIQDDEDAVFQKPTKRQPAATTRSKTPQMNRKEKYNAFSQMNPQQWFIGAAEKAPRTASPSPSSMQRSVSPAPSSRGASRSPTPTRYQSRSPTPTGKYVIPPPVYSNYNVGKSPVDRNAERSKPDWRF